MVMIEPAVTVSISGKFWAVQRPFFSSLNEGRLKAWGWLVLMIVLLMFESAVLVAFSYTQPRPTPLKFTERTRCGAIDVVWPFLKMTRDFSTAMSNKDEPGFYQGTRRYVVLLLSAAPIFAVSKFVQGKLGLDWRRWLTEHVCGLYFGNRAYYSLKNGLHKLPSSAGGSGDTKDERAEHDGDVAVGPTRGSRREEKQGGGIDNPISAVDNPDQRIGEDISTFTENCISVLVVIVGSVLKVGSFVGVLLSISPRLTAFVALYSLAGTLATTYMFGGQLKHLVFEGATREANFRFGLVRVREHAEEIAFYRGEKQEEAVVRSLLDKVVSNTHLRLWCNAQLAVVQNTFMWLTAVLPYLVVAQRYFAGEIEFGVISQTAMAFRVIQNAFSVVVTQIRTLASLASEVDRLHYLIATIEGMNEQKSETESNLLKTTDDDDHDYVAVASDVSNDLAKFSSSDDSDGDYAVSKNAATDAVESRDSGNVGADGAAEQAPASPDVAASVTPTAPARRPRQMRVVTEEVRFNEDGSLPSVLEIENMTLVTPYRKGVICRQLSFVVEPGQSVLIFGPSGCGKSSLLRAISGLWTTGQGTVRRRMDNNMFIPQKPYLPLGSLKAQMLYPTSEDESLATNSALEGILEEVQLGHLSARYGGLAETRDWQGELSLGEQQRLAFSRLLTNTPSVVYLDEATSALDEANEAKLYHWVQTAGVDAFISVGHRASLFRYHTHVLRGQSDGRWFFHTMDEFLDRHYSPALLKN